LKADIVVRIRIGAGDLEDVAPELKDNLPPGRLEFGHYEIRFRKGDPALAEILGRLETHEVLYEIREERTFRPRELAEAPALRISPSASALPVVADRSFHGACQTCHRGGNQVEDLVLPRSDSGQKGLTLTTQGHVLVNEIVARALVKEHVTGLMLRRTLDEEGRCGGIFQVLPTHTLPPLVVPPTRIEHRPEAGCADCGRGCLDIVSLLYFDLEPQGFCDWNLAREVSASGRIEAGIVVSRRLLRLLLELEAAPASAEPVVLV
jgi:hypothetical protein